MAPANSSAQVSEADRITAREQFTQGFQLQQTGKYQEALDKFNRAQAVFPAPTNMLHIAECQAQLGRLVEAAETYRGLARLQLPKDSPPSFFAAQTQGSAELQQVEARIPKVRIEVTPQNVPNLVVTIDDQPMNTALVGVDRAIDPGTHKIVVFAQGYSRQEQTVSIREKDPPKLVPILLQATSGGTGVVYGPAPSAPPASSVVTIQPPPPPDQPPLYQANKDFKPPEKKSSLGLLFGARLGAAVPTGDAFANRPIADAAGTGASLGLEADFRFAHKGYVGVIFDHGFYGSGNNPVGYFGYTDGQISANSNMIGVALGFISNPEGFGVTFDGALGYRWYNVSQTGGTSPQNATPTNLSETLGGGELSLGLGLWIPAGKSVRIVPRADAGIGAFSNRACDASTATASDLSARCNETSIAKTSAHAFFFLGVGGYYNLDFK